MVQHGPAAVSMEPLARKLGVTKGSAYWHFSNRKDLLKATLEYWEAEHTEAVIAMLRAEDDPLARLRTLMMFTFEEIAEGSVVLALQADASDDVVRPVLDRVSARRLSYLREQFAALGFDAEEAQTRATLAYAAYLGHVPLARSAPAALPSSPEARSAYVDAVVRALTAPRP